MSRPSRLALLALLAGAGGCSDRADPGPTSPSEEQAIAIAPSPDAKGTGAQRAAEERLARRVALALAEGLPNHARSAPDDDDEHQKHPPDTGAPARAEQVLSPGDLAGGAAATGA